MTAELILAPYRRNALALKMDMMPIFQAEQRINEIAFAGKDQAKSLFADFTRAYVYSAKLHAMVKLHVARATNESRKRRAVLILDYIPEQAKAKGLATTRSPTGAEDIREAFLYRDEEFLNIEDARAALEAAEALLLSKLMAFRDAAQGCRAMLAPQDVPHFNNAETQPNAYGTDANPRMVEEPIDAPPPIKIVDGFGTPSH